MVVGWSRLSLVLVTALTLSACGTLNLTTGLAPLTASKKDLEPGSPYLLKITARHPLPTMRGEGLNGPPINIGAMRGHVVVINVWASWCAPCRAEASQLAAVWQTTSPQGVRFVGIDIKDSRTAARAFQHNFHVPYPSIYDQPGLLLLALRGLAPQQPPTTLLIDRAGRIAARFPGGVTEQMLLRPVQSLIAEGT